MKVLFTSLLCLCFLPGSFAQSRKQTQQVGSPQMASPIEIGLLAEPAVQLPANLPGLPVGTVLSDAVTSIKVGESSNAFTALQTESTQISAVPGVGTNGGSLGFIFRQNINECGGATNENGIFRYSLSTDGGTTWDVGGGISTPNNPPSAVCYGLGPLNPVYAQNSRYPSMALFLEPDSAATPANLGVIYAGPVLSPSGIGWDGAVVGTALNASGTPTNAQEIYPFSNSNHYFVYSMVERVPGEFFYLSKTFGVNPTGGPDPDIHINRGIWDPLTETVDWSIVTTFVPDHYLGFDGAGRTAGISIGFSPDGQIGYLAGLGDPIGGQDSTYTVWFSESKDGGSTWGQEEFYELSDFPELLDSINIFFSIDTTTGDTVDFFSGVATTAFEIDVVVDKNDNPHALVIVGASTAHNGDGTYSDPGYSIVTNGGFHVLDFTRDAFGDWNMIYLSFQDFLRHTWTADQPFAMDPHPQASRSEDGSIIMFSWADTDSANSSGSANDAPDLFTVAYDVDANMMTPVIDRTSDDGIWASSVLAAHASPIGLFDGNCTYTMPIVVMDLEDGASLTPVSHWYFSDVTFDRCNDFTEPPAFFYNCKENPFSNVANVTAPDCGTANGAATVIAGGGIAPYAYQWSNSAGSVVTPGVSNLSAGIYEVSVVDSKGCSETLSVVINNATAPALSVATQSDISCFGAGDGSATITATGGGGSETYTWSNAEVGATATALPTGISTCIVTDANGCSAFIQVSIDEPAGISANTAGIDVLCQGDSSGSATVVATGGTGILTYAWSNGDNSETATNLPAGNASVVITDVNGCAVTESLSLSEPAALGSSLIASPNTQAVAPFNGNVVATINGGTEPYTLSWAGPDTFSAGNTDFLFGLCGGRYILTMTDGNGCALTDSVEVEVVGLGEECVKRVGIGEYLSAGIASYTFSPNPNTGKFSVQIELLQSEQVLIEIFTLQGKKIDTFQSSQTLSFAQSFDLSQHSSSLYLISITTQSGSVTDKILVQ